MQESYTTDNRSDNNGAASTPRAAGPHRLWQNRSLIFLKDQHIGCGKIEVLKDQHNLKDHIGCGNIAVVSISQRPSGTSSRGGSIIIFLDSYILIPLYCYVLILLF